MGAVWGAIPLLALDAWEHAYYLDYGPDKDKYFEAFFKNLNWGKVSEKFNRI
jgi:Fe-Mn family superoxide dismutase